jgi:hypothetical protein
MEVLLGFVDVVRTAAELNVLHAGGTAGGVRLDVVELEERALDTAAVRPDEGAQALRSHACARVAPRPAPRDDLRP